MAKKKKILNILIMFLVTCIIFVAIFVATGENKYIIPTKPNISVDEPSTEEESYEYKYKNTSKVSMTAEYLGTVERQHPEVKDEGLEKYPVYGTNLSATDEEKQAILDENAKLNASSTTYDSMDEFGNLYLNGEATGKKLYKHTASVGMYEGNVSDDEPAIIKRLTIKSRSYGNHITGLYAPAGEVIKIEMSEEDFNKTGGLTVQIGQVLTNGQANNIWLARTFNRMPNILNTLTTKQSVSYVGSFLGGPIYIMPKNTGTTFTVIISGAVAYSHFILGYTSEEEFEMNSRSSAPYFDLEVWDDAVRHSGPKSRASSFSYDELYDAAILWDKIALVSNKVPAGSSGNTGITFLYDPFVAAGSMVAFVGRYTVNCPLYCLTAALDYESAVTNAPDAFWGCIHEFNHHYQKFGFSPGDEVTNNAVSIVEYSLFTDISSNRDIDKTDEGSWAVGWNRYTNPSWVLKQTLKNTGTNSALDSYVNILNSFGQDIFIKATQLGNGSGGVDVWFKALCDATGYDMTYYFQSILHQTVSESVLSEYAGKNLPMYVPVATIFQTGQVLNGEEFQTVQPYKIEEDEVFTFDLNSSIVLPEGFSFNIKNITAPKFGTLVKNLDDTYSYTPTDISKNSGEIYLTLEITKDDASFEVRDVTLILEFMQGCKDTNLLDRTIYTYSSDTMYSTATEAYENNYSGYLTVIEEKNTNRVQNGNAEIWEPNPGSNAVMEVSGKIYVPSDGKYRIALRGRRYASLYVSLDGENYSLAGEVVNTNESPDFDLTNSAHYKDYDLKEGQWVYFKAVLLVTYSRSFIGVGWGKFNGESVNVSYLNAYNNSYTPQKFESDYFYTRDYTYDYKNTINSTQTLVETNYQPWDENYPISALFDENNTNFIHSNRTNITEENPFSLTVDLGETQLVNTITIYGEPTRIYLPKNFKLYGGETLDNLTLLKEVSGASVSNNNVVVSFQEYNIRYYKLVVTDTTATSTKYIAFRRIEFSYTLPTANLISPDNEIISYYGDWNIDYTFSNFGHIYESTSGYLTFDFTGTQFAIIAENSNFEVYIDNKLVENKTITNLAFISNKLDLDLHKVKIVAKDIKLDSILIWN